MARGSGPGPSFFTWSVKLAGFSQLVRNQKGQFQSGNQAFAEVNRKSLDWLKARSVDILDTKVHRAHDFRNRRTVAEVVESDDVHEVTRDYFRFWIPDRVESVDARVRSFYRAIDQGSRYWVDGPGAGRYVALIFYPGSAKPSAEANNQAAFADRWGARVLITKPVPAYGFLTIPKNEFQTEGIYAKYVDAAFKARGIKAVVKA